MQFATPKGNVQFELPALAAAAAPATLTLPIPVHVRVDGARQAAQAAELAARLGMLDLANRLNNVSIALTNLAQELSNAVFKSQALASSDAILALLDVDAFLADVGRDLAFARDQLRDANTNEQVRDAIVGYQFPLWDLQSMLDAVARHGFTAVLDPNTATALPGAAARYFVGLQNTGSETTTSALSDKT